MKSKYVIYGAGKRGKDALELVGKDNTYGFIDSSKEKVGTTYCGLPVFDVDSVKEFKDDVLYIVSPLKGTDQIINCLEGHGITNYIRLQKVDFFLKECRNKVFDKLSVMVERKVIVCGVSVSSLLINEYLIKLGYHPLIAVTDESELINYHFLKPYFNIKLFEDIIGESESVIYMESDIEEELVKKIREKQNVINIKDIYEDSLIECERILNYKNIHLGQRCFIVATGPSLRVDDLNLLESNHEICISMNRIYNIFDETKWRPDYYVIQDLKMIEDLKETISALDLPVKFVSGASSDYWEQKVSSKSIKFNFVNLLEMGKLPFFSNRVDKCIYEGMTVTYACLQMAVYMGFKEIYLLGLDHNYSNDLYAGSNHFAGYDTDKRIRLNTVHIGQNELAYISAKKYAEQNGIKIYNATRGGKLEVFERKDFDSLFNNSSK